MPTIVRRENGFNETIRETIETHKGSIIEKELFYSGKYSPEEYVIEIVVRKPNQHPLKTMSKRLKVNRIRDHIPYFRKDIQERVSSEWEKMEKEAKDCIDNYVTESEKVSKRVSIE